MREKMAAWASLEAALEKSETERLEVIQQRDKFRSIYDAGLVKEGPDGQFQPVAEQAEQEHIKASRTKQKRRENITPLNYDDLSVDLDLQEGDLM